MKKFWKKASNIMGTGYVDKVEISYQKIVDTFGEPHDTEGYKIDAGWNLEFIDGTIATVYNYKTGKNYLGDEGLETEEITYWHIGGHRKEASLWVKLALQVIDKNKAIKFMFGEEVIV